MKKQLKDTEMGDKIYDPAQDKWRTKAEVFFMNKLQIEEIPHNRIILDAFEIIEMMQEYADQSSPQPQPGRFKKFSLLEENETVTSSDTIVQPQPGRGVEEKIVGKNYFAEDLIIEEFMERYDEKYHITLINSEGNCNLTEIGFKECLRRFAKILLQEYRTQSNKDMYPKEDEFHVWVIPDIQQIYVTDRDHLPYGASEHITFDTWEGAFKLGQFLSKFCHYQLELDNEAGRFAESES